MKPQTVPCSRPVLFPSGRKFSLLCLLCTGKHRVDAYRSHKYCPGKQSPWERATLQLDHQRTYPSFLPLNPHLRKNISGQVNNLRLAQMSSSLICLITTSFSLYLLLLCLEITASLLFCFLSLFFPLFYPILVFVSF